jgi:gamma-glutamylputrescine oxidase
MAHEMGLESREIIFDRVKRYDIECDFKFGFLDLALKDSDMKEFEERAANKKRTNYPYSIRVVPKEEIREMVGSENYIGGLDDGGDGHLHPLNLCLGEASAAAGLGAQIFEQSAVTKIHHGDKPRVETKAGVVHANKIIVAGSYIIATEPLSDSLANDVLPQDQACCDQRSALDYFRLSADKRMLFGGMCNYSGRVPTSITDSLRPKMLNVFPQLENARIDYEWGGNIAISMNRIPQFGRIKGNTYYAQGYSGHGVAPTHLGGKMLADAVAGDSEQFDVFSKVHHWRLPGGKWFANPALALGMMYYRLKELL